jgi:hypothetical protein
MALVTDYVVRDQMLMDWVVTDLVVTDRGNHRSVITDGGIRGLNSG